MKNKVDFILDYETMSNDASNCAVIDCSVMLFEWDRFTSDNPYTIADIGSVKRFKLDVRQQVLDHGYVVDQSTIKFWSEQAPEVRAKIAPKKSDLTLNEYVDQLLQYLNTVPKISHWWSRSNTFDPIILSRIFKDHGKLITLEEKLKFWAVRDTRTFIDAKLDFPKDNGFIPVSDTANWEKCFKKHDSSWDVLADVMRLQAIARAELDMEQVVL